MSLRRKPNGVCLPFPARFYIMGKGKNAKNRGLRMIEHPITINGIDVRAQYSERAVKEIFLPLLKKLKDLRQEKGGRALMMLAAPPGAGKSTLDRKSVV